ncbi:hypothetical protein [Thiorhodovibrio frisius]|uniref:Uncharacterized protein n=1 Tax=Thiorhodovibrio frisius TaxID=631362 RepID=H8Z1Y4_9GAMM|nr:hypothetical protein [Thiorhodovibrio frisius]EIC21509.1 hypothetical protein Thi970DRAFT_01721 [Thiorhodovibrio frisius]WPL24093.1 hypothetical protein Thiofri_04305 [Thiorhodovibrio frisius]
MHCSANRATSVSEYDVVQTLDEKRFDVAARRDDDVAKTFSSNPDASISASKDAIPSRQKPRNLAEFATWLEQ